MDGEKKKRKMEEAEDEEKIEKFFALIKSTREVRERLVAAPEARETPAAGKPQSAPAPWNPTFVLEDFVEAPPQPPPPPEAEQAGTSREGEKQESGEGSGNKGLELDLNLSL